MVAKRQPKKEIKSNQVAFLAVMERKRQRNQEKSPEKVAFAAHYQGFCLTGNLKSKPLGLPPNRQPEIPVPGITQPHNPWQKRNPAASSKKDK